MHSKRNTFTRTLFAMFAISTLFTISMMVAAGDAGSGWMGRVADTTSLADLSIPGTHDSCALHEPLPGTAQCQKLSIAEQLNAGVRFLDIRCCNTGETFTIYHGIYSEGMTFNQVVAAVTAFLKAHPTESVIMSVKEENSNTGSAFNTVFQSYVKRNPGIWYLGTTVPILGEVRGKIVLFRRCNGACGIDASVWPDDTAFKNGVLMVEDNYKVDGSAAKWTAVISHLNSAKADISHSLFMTFSSGYTSGMFGLPNIINVSTDVNSRLSDYFKTSKVGHYGIIPMDFADASHCLQIISTNASLSK